LIHPAEILILDRSGDDIGLGWRERFDAEQNARKNRLKANSPREGFKAFLERKGIS